MKTIFKWPRERVLNDPSRMNITQEHLKFRRRFYLKGMTFIFLGFIPFLHACDNVKNTKERESMAITKMNPMPNVAIPPIDASSPIKTETATFALG